VASLKQSAHWLLTIAIALCGARACSEVHRLQQKTEPLQEKIRELEWKVEVYKTHIRLKGEE
jgi:hypothetical protein